MTNYKTNFHDQRGIAMIAVLMVLMLLTALAVALVYVTNTETGVNAN
jgi:Tfp pilus assembly protein PilX